MSIDYNRAQVVIGEIEGHISQCGGGHPAWYAGIAADPRARLFTEHRVDEKNGAWIFRDCSNEDTARYVEKHFCVSGRCAGDTGGGDWSTKFAYAYKITASTNEKA